VKPVVIFVDDEINILSSLERHLMREDYQKHFCNSAAEALKILSQEQVHLIVSDIRMPEMNGLELLKIVREKYPETIRMVLSGTSDSSMVIDAINKGEIFRYLSKPLAEVKELRTVISQALEFYALKVREKELLHELQLKNTELTSWKNRMSNELKIAEKLQLKLLEVPPLGDHDFTAVFAYEPSYSIGGDYFDLIKLPDGKFCVYVGDVSGHGVGSALISTLLKLTASDYVKQNHQNGPAAVCKMLNDFMSSHFQNIQVFSTLFLAIYDSNSHTWTACNCGHPPPMLFAPSGSPLSDRISPAGVFPIGFFDFPDTYTEKAQISWKTSEGEVLFFYTDGLYEAHDESGEMFDFARLEQTVSEMLDKSTDLPQPSEIIKAIVQKGYNSSADDCCAILVKT
jgi:serine phosphatase RsbU (regulator of sigma subunit)